MSYYDGNTKHLGAPTASVGPASSMGENFNAAFDRQWRVDSAKGLDAELGNLYADNMQRVLELTGEDLSLPSVRQGSIISAASNRYLGASSFLPSAFGAPQREENLAEFDKREQRLNELREQYPEIKSFGQMMDEVKAMRKEIEKTADETSATAGFAGSVAGLAGSIAGSFTLRDPLNIVTLMMGGWGSNVAKRMLTEAGIAAGVEGTQQFASVQPTRQMLGEEPSNPWASVAFAGIGGGVLRGAFEGAAPAFRTAERLINPARTQARAFASGLDGAQMNDAMIGRMFERAPDTPATRGARAALETETALRNASPSGQSFVSQRDFLADLQRTSDMYDGVSPTAMQLENTPTRPAFMEEVSFNKAVLHSENPALINRLDDLGDMVTAADARVANLTSAIENRTMGDAVGLVDEMSGARVKQIEEDLVKPGANSAALERELDTIVSSLGVENIAKAEKDFRIGPRKQLSSARQSAKAAQREYNKVAKDVDKALDAMNKRNARAMAEKALLETRLPEGMGLPQRVHVGDGVVSPLDPAKVSEFAKTVEVATEGTPKVADAIVAAPRVDGKVDIGLGEPIDENMLVPYGMTEKGDVIVRTAKEIMDELDQDKAMVEAMRSCSI